jgi:hypothetical protein
MHIPIFERLIARCNRTVNFFSYFPGFDAQSEEMFLDQKSWVSFYSMYNNPTHAMQITYVGMSILMKST